MKTPYNTTENDRKATTTEVLLAKLVKAVAEVNYYKNIEVTPSDTTILDCKALYVGTEGDLIIEDKYGNEVTYVDFEKWLLFDVHKVKAATSASNIIALY